MALGLSVRHSAKHPSAAKSLQVCGVMGASLFDAFHP